MFNTYLKTVIVMGFITGLPATSIAAQTILDFQDPKQAQQSTTSAPIAPSEFMNQTKAANAQSHKKFTQELTQQKNALANPKIPSLSDVQSMSQTPPPPFAEESSDTATTQPKNTPPTKHSDPMNAFSDDMDNAPPAPSSPAAAPAPTPSSPYTGFNSPNPSSSSGGQQPKEGNNFNIQY